MHPTERKARALAETGLYVSYLPIQWELEQEGLPEASEILANPEIRAAINGLCDAARRPRGLPTVGVVA